MDTSQVTSTLRCNYQLVLARIAFRNICSRHISKSYSKHLSKYSSWGPRRTKPFIHHDLLHMTTLGSFCLNLFFQFLGDHKTEKKEKCMFSTNDSVPNDQNDQSGSNQQLYQISKHQFTTNSPTRPSGSTTSFLLKAHVFFVDLLWYRYSPTTSPNLYKWFSRMFNGFHGFIIENI